MSEPRDIPGIIFPPPQPYEVNGAVNPNVRHERTDVNTRAILWFVVGLAASLAVVMLALWGMFHVLLREERAEKKSSYPLGAQQRELPLAEQLPPAPRLEGLSLQGLEQPAGRIYPPDLDAQHDLGRIRASGARVLNDLHERELNSFGWVPGEKDKVAHIPIAEAMQRLAAKLPARKGNADKLHDEFLEEPSGSSSGRAPRERP
jgi:hypothetical protein